jgi:hypothetical protein
LLTQLRAEKQAKETVVVDDLYANVTDDDLKKQIESVIANVVLLEQVDFPSKDQVLQERRSEIDALKSVLRVRNASREGTEIKTTHELLGLLLNKTLDIAMALERVEAKVDSLCSGTPTPTKPTDFY